MSPNVVSMDVTPPLDHRALVIVIHIYVVPVTCTGTQYTDSVGCNGYSLPRAAWGATWQIWIHLMEFNYEIHSKYMPWGVG